MTDESVGPYVVLWTMPGGEIGGEARFISKELRVEKITALRAGNPALQFEEREITTSGKMPA